MPRLHPYTWPAPALSLRQQAGGMYQNSLIENAGGVNTAAKITDAAWTDISYEQLLAWDPEVISDRRRSRIHRTGCSCR